MQSMHIDPRVSTPILNDILTPNDPVRRSSDCYSQLSKQVKILNDRNKEELLAAVKKFQSQPVPIILTPPPKPFPFPPPLDSVVTDIKLTKEFLSDNLQSNVIRRKNLRNYKLTLMACAALATFVALGVFAGIALTLRGKNLSGALLVASTLILGGSCFAMYQIRMAQANNT